MKNKGFFISTGEKNGFYTLKKVDFTHRYAMGCSGQWVPAGSERKDIYYQNLSTDRDEAIRKAKELTGYDLSIGFDLDEIKRLEAEEYARIRAEKQAKFNATDWSVFQFGKHQGRSVQDVFATDPGYIEWFSEAWVGINDEGKARTRQFCRDIVAPIIEARQAKEGSKAQAIVAALGADNVKDGAEESEGFVASVCSQLLRGSVPSDRALWILAEIFSKYAGRRNSKAYKAAYEVIESALYEALDQAA